MLQTDGSAKNIGDGCLGDWLQVQIESWKIKTKTSYLGITFSLGLRRTDCLEHVRSVARLFGI